VFISADTNETAEVTVGTSGAEMIINSVAIVAGGTVTVNTYTYTVAAS
jgi:putative Ca2+/H+ antiporter (TMEM165/GDT1 family)